MGIHVDNRWTFWLPVRELTSAPAQVIEPAAVIRDVANLESSETKHGN